MTENNNDPEGEKSTENNDSNSEEGVLDFNDFYELLGVDEETDPEVIFQKSRGLLAKYHPDISENPNADEIYKTVNRAQDVLTDQEQRVIYNSLGHEEYISRREKGGEMTLSESVKNSNQTLSETVNGSNHGEKKHGKSRNDISNVETEAKGDRSTSFRKRITESDGYTSLTSINFGLTPEESVRKIYRQMWLARIGMSAVFIFITVALGMMFPTEIMDLWGSIGLNTVFSVQTTVLVFVILFGVFIGVVTGGASNRILQPVADEINLGTRREEEAINRKKEHSRGLNTSVTDVNADSERNSWDSPNRYSENTENDETRSITNRTNKSLSHAPKMILAGMFLSAIGVVAPGSHPWVYISSVLAGQGVRTNPWLDAGGEGVESVVMLVNFMMGVSILVLIVVGVLYSMHGVSREAWYKKYFSTTSNPIVTAWDTIFVVLLSVLMMVVLVGVQELPNVPVIVGDGFVADFLIINSAITSLTVAVISVMMVWVVALVFKWRQF